MPRLCDVACDIAKLQYALVLIQILLLALSRILIFIPYFVIPYCVPYFTGSLLYVFFFAVAMFILMH